MMTTVTLPVASSSQSPSRCASASPKATRRPSRSTRASTTIRSPGAGAGEEAGVHLHRRVRGGGHPPPPPPGGDYAPPRLVPQRLHHAAVPHPVRVRVVRLQRQRHPHVAL